MVAGHPSILDAGVRFFFHRTPSAWPLLLQLSVGLHLLTRAAMAAGGHGRRTSGDDVRSQPDGALSFPVTCSVPSCASLRSPPLLPGRAPSTPARRCPSEGSFPAPTFPCFLGRALRFSKCVQSCSGAAGLCHLGFFLLFSAGAGGGLRPVPAGPPAREEWFLLLWGHSHCKPLSNSGRTEIGSTRARAVGRGILAHPGHVPSPQSPVQEASPMAIACLLHVSESEGSAFRRWEIPVY